MKGFLTVTHLMVDDKKLGILIQSLIS